MESERASEREREIKCDRKWKLERKIERWVVVEQFTLGNISHIDAQMKNMFVIPGLWWYSYYLQYNMILATLLLRQLRLSLLRRQLRHWFRRIQPRYEEKTHAHREVETQQFCILKEKFPRISLTKVKENCLRNFLFVLDCFYIKWRLKTPPTIKLLLLLKS